MLPDRLSARAVRDNTDRDRRRSRAEAWSDRSCAANFRTSSRASMSAIAIERSLPQGSAGRASFGCSSHHGVDPCPPNRSRHIAHLDMDAFMHRSSCCAIRSCAASRWSSAAAAGTSPRRSSIRPSGQVTRKFVTLRGYVGPRRDHRPRPTRRAHSACIRRRADESGAAFAPDAILLPTDFDRYRDYSHRFEARCAPSLPQIEDRGIDEDLYRPHRRARCRSMTCAADRRAGRRHAWRARDVAEGDQGKRAWRTGPVVLDRGRAQQASGEDLCRAR